MWLTRFAITRPVIVAMAAIAVAIFGLVSYRSLGVSLFPNVAFPIVVVSASYPGASPAEMEKLVIKPIEDQLDGIDNLDKLSATAQEGTATVVVQFKLDTNLDFAATDVQRRVDTARVNMPADLDPPSVFKNSGTADPILTEALSSKTLSAAALGDLINDRIVPDLKNVAGVVSVDTRGDTPREIYVYPDLGRLAGVGATLSDILGAVASNNANLPGGRIDAKTSETSVSVHADIVDPSDILRLPVPIGNILQQSADTLVPTIGSLATVVDGHQEQRYPTKNNGASAVILDIQRSADSDEIKTTDAVRAAFVELAKQHPDVRFSEIEANADYTHASINGVLQSLMEGILLTAIVMLLFLHAWRNAAVVMIAIPMSLLATFMVMRILNYTIDTISMMGLGLTIGILVDDSIVVLENITRHRDMGEAALDAAYNGRTEIGQAAIAITLVDVVVFLPIAFLSGIVGKYMKEFGIVIVVATLFSLLVSFTLTPLLAGRWSVKNRSEGVPHWAAWFQRLFERVARFYIERALPWGLGHRWITVASGFALVLAALSLVPLGFIGSEFVPSSNTGVLNGAVTFPVGTPLAVTEAALDSFSKEAVKIDGVQSVLTTAGRKPTGWGSTIGGHVGRFTVILDQRRRKETPRALEDLRKLGWTVPGAVFEAQKEGGGGSGTAIYYTLSGPDATLNQAANKLAALIREQPGAINVQTGAEADGPRLNIHIDPARATLLGVSPGDAATAARIAIGGAIATKVRTPSGLIDVRVQLPESTRNDVARVRTVKVRSLSGTLVNLSSIADFTMTKAPTKIERQSRHRIVRVTGDIDSTTTLGNVLAPVDKALATPGFLPPDTKALSAGDAELYQQTFSSMGLALATSVALVYMLMVVLYGSFVEPFVVMFSVPVAIIGALGGLALRHQSLNLFSLIAMIMLFGLVAKNGILLVDYANQMRARGLRVVEAMKAAAATRFRPILMTTCAMIFGMLPLALGLTEGGEERASMGTVLIGGLSSSLVLTLMLVPIVYCGIMGWSERRADKRRKPAAQLPELDVPRVGAGV